MREPSTRPSVVITGAAGYVGRHVVRAVADLGFDAVAVVRPGRGGDIDERARIVEADILAPGFDVGDIVGEETAGFIHLAWQDGFVHNAPSHMTHLSAHFALLSAVADAGVPRISALGTMHEVGYWEGAITDDTPTNPRSLYGVAKDALRRAAHIALADRVEFAWLRCYYIYGDDRRNNSIFARLLEAVDAGKPTMPFTSGKNLYDFIHVDELARQIAVASVTKGVTGVINCSTGHPVSLAERVEGFIAENELPIALEYGAFPDRPYDSPGVWGDAVRITQIMADAAQPTE
ncbi:NAD-dependent epimerase/dehydratase family protein [Microbacterium rhizomatis]|uniref:NAD-dependent epimerase/dehydratase family protein n=1 Tax=Microbacterium rhizomatis TaxID=1631477 RepID=A0A5J5J5C4_9MICO|nr:NAD-dependent epimerase/dehydratase family protein [Microbacterium rhizomatis]KAA9111240.1 NAD-dependent epimerase/dehydratase family protein [Microbacterium rhizomatis]